MEIINDLKAYDNDYGSFIEGHLIDTRLNGRNWRTPYTEKLTHILQEKVPGKDFMIDAAKIAKGVDAHYYGDGSRESILQGYADYSHGKYVKVLGPFPYNDGTNDVYYRFIAKLNNSKAASALVEHGNKCWIPFSHSAHIWPIEQTDEGITDFDFLGGALVVKGAYGPDAVISKMCNGPEAVCTKSLSAADRFCDNKTAEIISSLVSKSASEISYMAENTPTDVTKAPINAQPETPTVNPQQSAAPVAGGGGKGSGVESQQVLSNPRLIGEEEIKRLVEDAKAAEAKKWADQVTNLVDKDKRNTLNSVFARVSDEKQKKALIDKYVKHENVDIFKEFLEDISPFMVAPAPVSESDNNKKGGKSASSSLSPSEPVLPPIDTTQESQAAAAANIGPVNKGLTITKFILSGGRLD
jgi:hypothetical protein